MTNKNTLIEETQLRSRLELISEMLEALEGIREELKTGATAETLSQADTSVKIVRRLANNLSRMGLKTLEHE